VQAAPCMQHMQAPDIARAYLHMRDCIMVRRVDRYTCKSPVSRVLQHACMDSFVYTGVKLFLSCSCRRPLVVHAMLGRSKNPHNFSQTLSFLATASREGYISACRGNVRATMCGLHDSAITRQPGPLLVTLRCTIVAETVK